MTESATPVRATQTPLATYPWVIGAALTAVVVTLAASWETLRQLAWLWWVDESYGHGLLVLPIVVWLIWQARRPLTMVQPKPSLLGLLLLIGGGMLWLASQIMSIHVGAQFSTVVILGGIVWAFFGLRMCRYLLFPVAYILVAVPIWEVLVPFLRDTTAIMSADIARSLSVPVFKEGRYLHIPGGTFIIADVCAGLRFFLATLSIATLYAYLTYGSALRSLIFVAVAIVWTVIFNWIRVVAIILIGHHYGIGAPIVQDHNTLGWGLFAFSMLPLFWFGARLARAEDETQLTEPKPVACLDKTYPSLFGLLALFVVLLPPAVFFGLGASHGTTEGEGKLTLPEVASWQGPDYEENFLGHEYPSAETAIGRYESGVQAVTVFLAHIDEVTAERELISDVNRFFDSRMWDTSNTQAQSDTFGSGFRLSHNQLIIKSISGETRVAWAWYSMAGRTTGDAKLAKLLRLPAWFSAQRNAAAVIVVSSGVGTQTEQESAVRQFVSSAAEKLTNPVMH